MITIHKTKRMLSFKRGSIIERLVHSIEADRKTLRFYARNHLLGCLQYFAVKARYKSNKDKLAEYVNSFK